MSALWSSCPPPCRENSCCTGNVEQACALTSTTQAGSLLVLLQMGRAH
eukprot:COSAG01_NODE_5035_length_4533_cov_1.888814_5_plen_48_part_00